MWEYYRGMHKGKVKLIVTFLSFGNTIEHIHLVATQTEDGIQHGNQTLALIHII